jgi:uncharacterized protein (DUF362 family)
MKGAIVDIVALVKYKQDITAALQEGLKLLGGFGNLVSPVLIKPNICTISDNTGYAVTRIDLVKNLVKLLYEENEKLTIRIIESDSQSKYAEEAYEKFGYKKLEEDMQRAGFDLELVDLSQAELKLVEYDGLYFENPELPDVLTEASYFISLAVPKTHNLSNITGAMKNQFGVLPRKDQGFYHSSLEEIIVDLNQIIQPDLSIIDARVGIQGWNGTKTRPLNAFIFGRSPLAVDATMARIMGFNPEKIPHLVKSNKHGLGTLNPEVRGEKIEDTQLKFKPRGEFLR